MVERTSYGGFQVESDGDSEDSGKIESKIRLCIKRNFKMQRAYEYSVRGDTIAEVEKLNSEVKKLAEDEMKGGAPPGGE